MAVMTARKIKPVVAGATSAEWERLRSRYFGAMVASN